MWGNCVALVRKIVLITLAFLCFIITLFIWNGEKHDDEIVSSLKCYFSDDEIIKLYRADNELYAFVPSGISLGDFYFKCDDNGISIDGNNIHSGDSFNDLKLAVGESYELKFKDNIYSFAILQSDNVSTFFVNNASGNLEEFFNDTKHKEPVRLTVYNENGEYQDSNIGSIKGRGNSTWLLDKKPFNLYLDEQRSLLGLPESTKYCLLANGYDKSNIRNKLVYDFANKLEPNWTPSCEYVDLYINGEYYGLYLLAESVEVSESKINISPETGYWYSMSIPSRVPDLEDYISTDDGRIVEIKHSGGDNDVLLDHLNEFEQKLKDGSGLEWIDMDSWSRKYLIEDIFLNTDIASLYFYWDSDNNAPIYAGPQWDYDNALGNAALNQVRVAPTAQLMNQESRFTNYGNSWFSELAGNPIFEQTVKDRYKEDYRPLLEETITVEIDALSDRIEKASYCNSIRWKKMYDSFVSNNTPGEIKNYLIERVAFLDSKWIDNEDWYSVRLNRGEGRSYLYYSVKAGESFTALPEGESIGISNLAYWENEQSGKAFSSKEEINGDIQLKAVTKNAEIKTRSGMIKILTKTRVFYFSVFSLFFISLLFTMIIDRRRRFAEQI